jgi:hypothetical protein
MIRLACLGLAGLFGLQAKDDRSWVEPMKKVHEKFKEHKGYDVPTLIAQDGVHPSNPKAFQGDFSEEGLRSNGFLLRSFVSLLSYADVIRSVLQAP